MEPKVLLVGVSESVAKLMGSHESIVRCIAEVKLRRMEPEELYSILSDGFERLDIECSDQIKTRIVDLSDGFPHFTHLLGLKCCFALACRCHDYNDQKVAIKEGDYKAALKDAIDSSQQTLRHGYREATETTRKKSELFLRVIEGVAMADSKEVQVAEIVENLNFVYGLKLKPQTISYHLGKLTCDERNSVLVRPRTGYYKFSNPMMRAYVRMKLDLDNQLDHHGQLTLPFMNLENRRLSVRHRRS